MAVFTGIIIKKENIVFFEKFFHERSVYLEMFWWIYQGSTQLHTTIQFWEYTKSISFKIFLLNILKFFPSNVISLCSFDHRFYKVFLMIMYVAALWLSIFSTIFSTSSLIIVNNMWSRTYNERLQRSSDKNSLSNRLTVTFFCFGLIQSLLQWSKDHRK